MFPCVCVCVCVCVYALFGIIDITCALNDINFLSKTINSLYGNNVRKREHCRRRNIYFGENATPFFLWDICMKLIFDLKNNSIVRLQCKKILQVFFSSSFFFYSIISLFNLTRYDRITYVQRMKKIAYKITSL